MLSLRAHIPFPRPFGIRFHTPESSGVICWRLQTSAEPTDNFTTLLCLSLGNCNPPFHCANYMNNAAIIYYQMASAWGEALVYCMLESYTFCAAHPTPSFIPPPLNPYNRLFTKVLMERDEDLEKVEMEDRETEDTWEGSNIYDERKWRCKQLCVYSQTQCLL